MGLALLRVMAAVAGVPLLALMLLVALGQAAPVPALWAAGAVVMASFGLALVWTNDLRVLADLLHQAGSGGRVAGGAPTF